MAKNLQVNLAFTADTNAAMQNLQTLRNSLNEISSLPFSVGKGLSQDLQTASHSAQQLQRHLGAAMDVKTGNINLNKLQSSLQSSNQSLSQLTSGLLRAGTTGEKAFLATYSAIAQSNIQLKKSNTLLSQFALTMKNTAKWQLSSSILHGLISGFNSAIGYAKDLDKSLNNIQIVTQQSADQMAEFAKQANKAAKELKTTTVAYTDAALIYYQQGLKGDDVTKRADTTVKLANVTGESAETVSQWMTSVWNNFDDGSKSLEYYADVMTALGAATASSSDEIAQGLEKFAAVADTVGLSYESATAALATITATTRQSADVVGTALKTLFARIQDLDLGKTLEDGTTLGSYSEALSKVGIDIKEQNGQLKEMDDILDEMGAKWKTLDGDQQVALAKNVAGIRQYTQLIALMDNYDFYKQNQGIAAGAEGTLEEQAEIYEQSWEAASKNVKASLESMYNVLIPTDFIVDFTNGLADVVSGFTEILDAAGGLRTILLMISSVVLTKFQAQIAVAMDTGLQKTKALITSTQKLVEAQGGIFKAASTKIKSSFVNAAQNQVSQNHTSMNKEATGAQAEIQKGLRDSLVQKDSSGNPINLSDGFKAQVKSLQQIEQYNTKILNLKDKMTQAEFEELQLTQQHLKTLGEEKAKNLDKINDLKLQLDVLKEQQGISTTRRDFQNNTATSDYALSTEEASGYMAAARAADLDKGLLSTSMANEDTQSLEFQNIQALKTARTEILEIISNTKQAELEITDVLNNRNNYEGDFKQLVTQTIDKLVEQGKLTSTQGDILKKNVSSYKNMDKLANTLKSRVQGLNNGAQGVARTLKIADGHIEDSVRHGTQLYTTNQRNAQIINETKTRTQELDQTLENIVKKGASFGNMFVKGLQGASQMAMGLSMLQGAITSIGDAFKEGDFNLSQFLSGLTSLGMAIPMVVSGFQSLMTLMSGFTAIQHLSTKASYDKITALVTEKGVAASLAAEEKILAAAKASGATVEQITIVLSELKTGKTLKEALATAGLTGATWAQVAANLGLQASMWPVLLITLAVVAAFAILVGIIALVVKAFKNAEANSPEGKLKALEEAADESQKALERVKNEVNAVNDSLEELKDKYKTLDAMQKGTIEWANAASEVNKQITDLLDKYSGLGQYVYRDTDGVLRLLDEGYDYIEQKNQEQIAVVTNSNINDRIKVADQKIDNYIDKWKKKVEDANTKKETLESMKKSPQDQLTDLFNNYIADYNVGNGSKFSQEPINALDIFGMNAGMVSPADILSKGLDPKEYYKDLEEIAKLKKEIEQLSNTQIENKMAAAGSVRDADQAKEIFGKNITHEDLLKKGRDKITMGWEDSFNYSKNDAAWKDIEQFMKLQGEGTEYVAQRGGSMILKIEGEEKAFSEDQVKDVLAEYYSTEAIEQEIANSMRNTLKEIVPFGNMTSEALEGMKGLGMDPFEINKLSNDTLIALDNLQVKLKESFEKVSKDIDSDKVFAEIIKGFGNSEAALEEFAATFDGVDWSNIDNVRSLGLVAEQLEQGTITIEEFTYAVEKMNAATELSNMGAFFSEAAQNLGLNEEDAAIMQEYARCLMEAAGEADDLSNSLETDAQAAADLAVEITRMNKGIDSLADGFENWSDILNNSSKTSYEYAEAMLGIKSSLADVLDIESDMLSNDFVKKHLNQIEKAAQGDEKAIDDLRAALDEDIIQNIILTSPDELGNQIKELDSKLRSDLEALNAEIPDLEVGMVLTGATEAEQQFIDTANRMVQEAGMTADEANAYFAGMGYEPIVEQTDIEDATTQEIPESRTTTTVKSIGFSEEPMTIMGKKVGFIKSPQLVTETKVQDISSTSAKGKARVFGFSGGAKKPTGAKIVGFKKKAGGSSSNYSSKNSGGSSPGSSSKSGSDSSSKTATKEKINFSEEGDFYHDINREIDRLADTTDRLADAKDRAFGDDKIKNLNKEIQAVQNEIKAQEKLIARAKEKIKIDKEALKTYGATYDKNGEITNYNSMLQNEINKYNAAVEAYNKKAAQKDAGSLSDEQWEAAEKALEAAEERYNGLDEWVSEYEADLDIKDDAVEAAAEKARQILDLQLEGIQYGVDIQIEVNDYDLKVLEHLLDRLDDDKFDGTAKIKNMTSQMDEQFDNIEIYKAGIRQTLVSAGADQAALDAYMAGDSTAIQGLDLSEEQMNMLMDYSEGIMESEEAILELRDSIEGQVMATFEAWHEEIENNARAFEHATTMAQSYKDIIGLIGKSRLGIDNAILKDLEATQQKSANAYMANAKVQMESTAAALKEAQESLANAVDDESREMWQGVVDELGVQLMEDQEAFMSSWNDALQTAADNFTAQMDRAFENLEKSLTGIFGSFDQLSNYMEQQQSVADRYLNASEKTYELSKLNRKLQKDLDKTDSKKAQKELLAMQEEIAAYQASGVEMSERDLQALQKKYDLKLAEIALEEAQNAKSTVRLTRDSEGNFGYVYTADENKVADAQQKYEDTLEANRQLAVSQQEELTNAIVENRQKMVEALREVRREDYEDTAAYTAALEQITAFYTEQEAYLINEYQKVVQRSQLIYEEDYMSYTGWSQAKSNYTDQYYMAWQEKRRVANEIEALQSSGQWALLSEQQRAAYEQELAAANAEWLALQEAQSSAYLIMGQNADGWVFAQSELMTQLGCNIMDGITNGDGSSGTNGLLAALGTVDGEGGGTGFFGEANAAALGWEQATSATLDLIGEDYGSLQTLIQNTITGENGINDTIEANKTKLGTLSKTSKDEFGKVTTEVNTWQTNYSKKVTTATSDTNNLNTAIQNLTGTSIQVIASVKGQPKVDKLKTTIEGLNNKNVTINTTHKDTFETNYVTNGTSGATSVGSQGNGVVEVGDLVTYTGKYYANSSGGGASGSRGSGTKKQAKVTKINSTGSHPIHLQSTDSAYGWVKQDQIAGYDTGGYTGDWGPDGKLAFLHQKEIVLNADDTENLLKAVSMIRDISSKLEANALIMNQLASLNTSIGNINTTGQIMQQDVTIHAEFPNATNHNEIEEAFRNLSTLASQYTNRKI